MSLASVIAARLRGLFQRTRSERELDEELRFHLQMQIDDNVQAGMNPSEARYAALRSFGGIETMKETYREGRSFAFVETTIQDIRYALRSLGRSPGFTVTAVTVLALAIGANTAMFSVLNAVLLKPLPYKWPEQLVTLSITQNNRESSTAHWNIEQWRNQNRSFEDMAFFDGLSATLATAERVDKISVVRHSPNLFSLLGVQPAHGRVFSHQEAEQRQPLSVISHAFWQRYFGGSLDAIGASINIDGFPRRIIGILPDGFQFSDADVWEPHTMYPNWDALRLQRGTGIWSVIGRLRTDVSFPQAQTEMSTIASRLDDGLPAAQRNRGISITPLSVNVTGRNARLALWMLSGSVFLVLLIAATNVASISLARASSREREIVVRAALGASRLRIVRQLLAESITLAGVSGLLGLLVAIAGIRLILVFQPVNLARLNEVSLDARVLVSALVLCLLTGILVGLAPAMTMARRDLRPSGQDGGRGHAGGLATRRARRALVVTEFALAVVLLIGAGLLVQSLRSLASVDLGFRPERILSVNLSTSSFTTPVQRTGFYNRVLEALESRPGVESVGITSELFIGSGPERVITVEGDAQFVTEQLRFRGDEISPRFFETIGTPLLRGRFFTPADGLGPKVAIINDAMGRRLWPGRDPVGRRFRLGAVPDAPLFTVVGVVGDMRRQGLERDPIPQMFEPLAQNPARLAIILVRTSAADPLRMAATVEAAVRQVDKHAPLYGLTTVENQLGGLLAARRFQTSLLGGFSAVALLMAAIGIYGLIQYSVTMRTREIGIRMAVGSEAGQVFRMIIGEGLKLSASGLVLGILGALLLGRFGSSFLFGVTPTDPPTFIAVSLLLTAVATAACYFPARRAMNVEPVAALRQE